MKKIIVTLYAIAYRRWNGADCASVLLHLGENNRCYVMDSHLIQEVSEEKITVFISNNFKPANQCKEAYGKDSEALGITA